jgi:colanic acid biosynthesis protein WcaH
MTPIVNVDLLIRNRRQETLLTWRADNYWPPGWHVPGGIVRFKEKIADRIRAVAVGELHASVKWKDPPLAVHELIQPVRKERGHFISFLYVCTLTRALDEDFRYKKGPPQPGQWAWHATCPRNIIPVHEIYRKLIESSARL